MCYILTEKKMTTKAVAEKYKIARETVTRWCKKNNIERILGKNGIMEYVLNKEDLKLFLERCKQKGRPTKKPVKQK